MFGDTRGESQAAPSHRSLALPALLSTLHPEAQPGVLDLGPAIGSNLEFLSRRACRVWVADFHRSLLQEPMAAEPLAVGAIVGRLLALGEAARFDAVLAWDLFSYLRPDQITALFERLAPACDSHTLLLALVWTTQRIPKAPLRYRILDPETLSYEGPLEQSRPSPRYGPHDLSRLAVGFEVKTSFLLRHGMQEYLFRRTT